ncbi:hypothetical protein C731_4652 [Mycolicibacterium hassiacum DSM 44199]|jgi:hypothetical protein|uniref:Uncharacterized protein n=1 Tax=Mycolicibacterium hassiacum (strain DSM 44199 / CIP 105218 / JCM 12690 / 3849) TaxID=1122247 RepID=K5B754_MYCHD|nr:hypothetical protein [Mycolicibacterium hassiacum]EKF21353.1 hypothetical protein C731_4652 [Mycolicibacterium hassiacum DSM 44199]MDA4088643.1 hypothetical protein [Mycolicibacterium hassiacum DSM 44199]PZN25502.1 MAG: hypothetical protein DIU75_00285 [Mycolicibacterium hassiacum]VCT90183.1 hypothetical protein MHAS_01887 [Mycolicibacterium hassiacum DSM 44199]
MTAAVTSVPDPRFPRWLRFVLSADRAGSAWFIGAGFFLAPATTVLSPWPAATAAVWILVALAALWLALLGVAMAVGLAIVLCRGVELPEDFWAGLLARHHRPPTPAVTAAPV